MEIMILVTILFVVMVLFGAILQMIARQDNTISELEDQIDLLKLECKLFDTILNVTNNNK